MNRTLAGIYDPRGSMTRDAREVALSAGLESEANVEIAELGPLTVAWTEGPAANDAASRWLCRLDGHVYNLEDVAARVGLPAHEPERVLATAYSRLGDDLFVDLRGDFALLLWDRETGRGVLAVDHFGGRGLVFRTDGPRFVFASEVRNLLRMLPRRPEPDRAALAHWIYISGPPADRTLFEGVRRVRPGYLVRFGPTGHEQRCYWKPRYQGTVRTSRADAAMELRETIVRAIDVRSTASDTTAIMLSGGLDSSSVAALAMHVLPPERAPIAGYSAVFPNHAEVDESALIATLTDRIGLPSVRIAVEDGSVLAGGLEYLGTWQLPPTSPNLFFWGPLLRRAADDGVTALLDGEGGDEGLGYSGYLLADLARRGQLLKALSLAQRFPAGGRPGLKRTLERFKRFGLRPAVPMAVRRVRRRFRNLEDEICPDWFLAETARAYVESDEEWAWLEEPGPLWARWRTHTLTWSAGPVSAYDHIRQRAGSAGIEARHPLNDVGVVELMMRLPPEYAFDQVFTRPLFRESTAGLLPDEVRLRPDKSYFDQVFHGILKTHDLEPARRLLSPGSAELAAYIDLDRVYAQLLAEPPPSDPDALVQWAVQVWRLVTGECWLRTQADPSFPERMLASGELRGPQYELLAPF